MGAGDLSSVSWGARWTPPRSQVPSNVIKRAHPTRLGGSSVGSLAPPRATPRLGGVYVSGVSCQYFPCSFVLALRELGLRLGVKARLPLRASSRGVLPGAGALAGCRHRLSSSWLMKTAASNSRQTRDYVLPRSPAQASPKLLPSPTKSREDGAWACFRRPRKRKPQVCSYWLVSPHLK
jgi:hypothetical protein